MNLGIDVPFGGFVRRKMATRKWDFGKVFGIKTAGNLSPEAKLSLETHFVQG